MRGTIIGVFSVVVLIVSVLSFGLMRATLGDVSSRGEAARAVTAAVAQLQVEGLRIERWLAQEAAREEARVPLEAASPEARGESATTLANTLEQRAKAQGAFSNLSLTLVVIVDAKGVVMGRNRSALMRGDKLGARHPEMLQAIESGTTGSSVWVSKQHNEQLLASYAPIRDSDGKIVGGVAVGTAFSNERLQATSEATSKLALFAATADSGGKLELVARSTAVDDAMLVAVPSAAAALSTDQVIALSGLDDGWDSAGKQLGGYGGSKTVVMAATQARVVGSASQLLWPVLGVLLLGIVLVAVGAHLIDNYISQPIGDLEEGLLAIINGQTDLRFELEHKVLGGVVFRINSLLNQLLGIREDDTDAEGRPSVAPSSSSFGAALVLDERMASLTPDQVEDAVRLRNEPPEDYYKRIFDEYLAAKRELGDPVDGIKFAPFRQRIQSSEQQLSAKHGKPFRYRIESQGREVVFVAVPLA
jgi:hypothetical protein